MVLRDWCASCATRTSDPIRRTWNTVRTNNNELRTGAATREENTHRSYMCSHDRCSFESIQRVRYAIYTDGQRITRAHSISHAPEIIVPLHEKPWNWIRAKNDTSYIAHVSRAELLFRILFYLSPLPPSPLAPLKDKPGFPWVWSQFKSLFLELYSNLMKDETCWFDMRF